MAASHITIDVRMLHSSGIGTYIQNTVPGIMKTLEKCRFTLIGSPSELKSFEWSNAPRVTVVPCETRIYGLREQFALKSAIPDDTDVMWSPHYNMPIFYHGVLLVTIHDALHVAHPEYAGGVLNRAYARFMFHRVARAAARIVCVSNFTAQELARLQPAVVEKTRVIYNGVNADWFSVPVCSAVSPNRRRSLVFVGNVKPHKNLRGLLEGFRKALPSLNHELVIVGKRDGFIVGDQLQNAIQGIEQHVRFTGKVTNVELKQMIHDADALVLPSLYEGFGLPPLEAMAVGCPVVVSNAASIPEICGDAALYFSPLDTGDIAAKLVQVLTDDGLRSRLREKGRERAKVFSWDRTIAETAKVLGELVDD